MEKQRDREEIMDILARWHRTAMEIRWIDTSHDEEDIRHHYILDRLLVLRMNNTGMMTDKRLAALNRMIGRYREMGLEAPLFIPYDKEKELFVINNPDGTQWYLSEYLDRPVADQWADDDPRYGALDRKILEMTAGFSRRYHDVDLGDTFGMYSLFDLSPYDVKQGKDEKQDNCDGLTETLRQTGEEALAEDVGRLNDRMRERLLRLYPTLPRCAYQGDENGSNVCLDEAGELCGIFDFNMAGQDVCVNYLANHALYGFAFDQEALRRYDAQTLMEKLTAEEKAGTVVIREHYPFSETEEEAYPLYLKIVELFQWPMRCDYEKGLQDPETHGNTARFLRLLTEEGWKQVSNA